MTPMWLSVRIGLRLLRVRDRGRGCSLALSVLGIALAAVSVLLAAASFSVVEHRKDVGLARSEVWDESQAAHVWSYTQVLDYDRRNIYRIDIATDGTAAADGVGKPPGVDTWPRPGEQFVSPRFAEEAEQSADLLGYAPGEIVGRIGDNGLRAPDELVVYRGVTRAELGELGTPTASFGGNSPANQELDESQLQGLAVFFVTCLGLPVCAFLVVAARLSATTRQRRIAAMRLLGVSARQAARINAVEQVAVGVGGGLLALAVYPVLNGVLADSGILVMKWFPQTTAVGPIGALFLLAGCAGLSWLVGSRTAAEAIRAPWQSRREVPRTRTSAWALLPLLVGAAGLWWLFWRGFFVGPNEDAVLLDGDRFMTGSVLLTGVGLLLAASPITQAVGRWWGRSQSLSRRLGGARASFDARGSGRLAAGVLVLVFAMGVGIGHSRDARATSELAPGAAALFTVNLEDLDERQKRQLLAVEGAYARGASVVDFDQETAILFTDCIGLRALASAPVSRCALAKGDGYRLSDDLPANLNLSTAAEGVVEVATPKRSLEAAGYLEHHDAVLPWAAGQEIPGGSNTLLLMADAANIDQVMSAVLRIDPYSNASVYGENPAQTVNNLMLGAYIRLAIALGSVVGLMALLLALLDRAAQRRRLNARLLAQGMEPGRLRAVQAWEAAASVVPQVTVALSLGVVGAMAWQYTGGLIREPDWAAFSWLALGTGIAVAGTVAVAALATPRRVDVQLLRAE